MLYAILCHNPGSGGGYEIRPIRLFLPGGDVA